MSETTAKIAPADVVDKNIPWEKWNLLSEGEIAFLKQMGFNLIKEKSTPKTPKLPKTYHDIARENSAPAEHLLLVKVKCGFCKSNSELYFDMRDTGKRYLKSVEISEEHFAHLLQSKPVEKKKETLVTCHCCSSVLSELTKDELIKIVLRQHNKLMTGRG